MQARFQNGRYNKQGGWAWLAALGGWAASNSAAIIAAGASLYGGYRANSASAQQAGLNRDFQEEMSRTAHQREVADLRAAGLNPILSGTGGAGASTPGGSMASQIDPVTPAVSSGLAAKLQKDQRKLIRTQATREFQQAKAAESQDKLNQQLQDKAYVETQHSGYTAMQAYHGVDRARAEAEMTRLKLQIEKAAQAGLVDQAKMLGEKWYKMKRRLDAGLESAGKVGVAVGSAYGARQIGRALRRKPVISPIRREPRLNMRRLP